MQSKRLEFGGKEGPGPGEYEPYRSVPETLVENLNNPDAAADRTRFNSKIPRYHEMVAKEEEKKVSSLC